jgi:gliding motility-associated-like protein
MAGDSVKLNGTVSGDSVRYYWTPSTYLDNPNSLNPTASPPVSTVYTLHAQSIYNCGEDTSNVFIRVYQKLTIPNTFTPNNDGINDTWDIKNLFTYPECVITVFDRYGQQVYQSYGYPKSWDGKYHGKTVPQGTYYYVIDLGAALPKDIRVASNCPVKGINNISRLYHGY